MFQGWPYSNRDTEDAHDTENDRTLCHRADVLGPLPARRFTVRDIFFDGLMHICARRGPDGNYNCVLSCRVARGG